MIFYNLLVCCKGEVILVCDFVNQNINLCQVWQYIFGQCCVCWVFIIVFDLLSSLVSGLMIYDDGYMYNGFLECYNWELIGKEEMYVFYNNNWVFVEVVKGDDKVVEIFLVNYMSFDYLCWELYCVWVVEVILKDDECYIYECCCYYFDEDIWMIFVFDFYDGWD